MATYEEIYGKRVKDLSADPTLDSSYEGQVWYNSTSGDLKSVVAFQSWSSSSPLSTARQSMASFGTQTSAVASTGATSGSSPYGEQNLTEEYNGTGWTSATNNPLSMQYSVGTGTETSGLVFGGNALPGPGYVATTNEYDGSSWTSGGSLGSPIGIHAGLGTQTAALQASGYGRPPSPGSNTNTAEEYNGTSWTSTNTVNTARRALSGSGIQTAGIISGGLTTTRVANSEEYNGTSFTEGSDINTARTAFNMCGGTTESNSFIVAGTTGPGAKSTATEYYDGTSWTTQPATIAAGRSSGGAGGIQNTAVLFGGANPSISGDTEELNFSVNTITAAAWSSGGNLNTGGQDVGGTGTKNAALAMGRRTGASGPFTQSGASEEYDGSSWTSVPSLNTARGEASGSGTQTAALCFGGAPNSTATENYNGSSWTTNPASLNTGRSSGASFGASNTSTVFCGGYGPAARQDAVEEWNGSAWTTVTSMPIVRYNAGGAGIETAGIVLGGGNAAGTASLSSSNEYNGSSWTSGGSTPVVIEGQGMNGTQTACIAYGGPTSLTTTFTYDGTTFITNPSMASNRATLGASKGASITNTVGFGGSTPPNRQMNNTEEFTSETEAITAATLTTS